MKKLNWLMLAAMLFGSSTLHSPCFESSLFVRSSNCPPASRQCKRGMQKIKSNIAVVVVDRGGNPLTAERMSWWARIT
ncbi:hypothetical protein I6G74_00100 [Acinetobacter baumannii]|uniref:hypothetical protein n=1 Tax=Acinetobacter baumannii TaxID=470 RepID=UPI001935B207|nr:hypothetical protein I6G74_00100 [Acinetobacter baumannii]